MDQKRRVTKYSFILVLSCITINVICAKLALYFDIPVYLDSIGTILSAMLGGYLPATFVGFFSNSINGLNDPITLYYSLISILIGITASFLFKKGFFKGFTKPLITIFIFSLIGGGIGSVLTWLLYGFNFGMGISAPLAQFMHGQLGISEFYSQLTADMLIDLLDKTITVFVCIISIKFIPKNFLLKFPNGELFDPKSKDIPSTNMISLRTFSLRNKVMIMIASSALILGVVATTISYVIYSQTMTNHYISTSQSITEMAIKIINADSVDKYLASDYEDDEYRMTEVQLKALRDSIADIEYLYVYKITEQGCYVVFDIDTPELKGEELGTFLMIEPDFAPYLDDMLNGRNIPAVISNGAYGWLLTVYTPIIDSNGNCVAYAAADIKMKEVMTDRAVFIIKMSSLLFGVSILLVSFSLWFSERKLVEPINAMAKAANDFAFDKEAARKQASDNILQLDIHTGDEIENLYNALSKTVTDIHAYISDINTKASLISQMQTNIIYSFADMVENRDTNTGEHIKHTAQYVNDIARQLLSDNIYTDVINEEYIQNIVRCAPLHDLGKIRISDTILNKPGKLTDEEFSQIKTHTTAGKEILEGMLHNIKGSGYLSEAVNMATYHHERWDGGGYPMGLSGNDIPLSARIMAVADVYDALISKRSYKEALPKSQACEIIKSESSTHFDPIVVSAFLKTIENQSDNVENYINEN